MELGGEEEGREKDRKRIRKRRKDYRGRRRLAERKAGENVERTR